MRSKLVTVRRPGARIAPMRRTWACCQERWTNSGANARMTPAKRAGRGGMATSLGGDATNLTVTSASSPGPAHQPAKMAKDTMQARGDWARLGSLRTGRELADAL